MGKLIKTVAGVSIKDIIGDKQLTISKTQFKLIQKIVWLITTMLGCSLLVPNLHSETGVRLLN